MMRERALITLLATAILHQHPSFLFALPSDSGSGAIGAFANYADGPEAQAVAATLCAQYTSWGAGWGSGQALGSPQGTGEWAVATETCVADVPDTWPALGRIQDHQPQLRVSHHCLAPPAASRGCGLSSSSKRRACLRASPQPRPPAKASPAPWVSLISISVERELNVLPGTNFLPLQCPGALGDTQALAAEQRVLWPEWLPVG